MDEARLGIDDVEEVAWWGERDVPEGDVPAVWDRAGGGETVAGEGVGCADEGGGIHCLM